MRNVFDQYEQPENQLTHALVSALHNDRALIRPFLRFLGAKDIPSLKQICLGQQEVPGGEADYQKVGVESLPDACFYDDDGWAVLIESKVQAGTSSRQLALHRKTAQRYGYEEAQVVLITVDIPKRQLPPGVTVRQWREVYKLFRRRAPRSSWARHFVDYMQVFESNMNAQGYDIRGTLTMFDGFRFDEQQPYTYREGKRLIRLIRQEFLKKPRLIRDLGIDPEGSGRSSITQGPEGGVWDFIPLKEARGSAFTAYPHLTMAIRPTEAAAAVTVPHQLRGSIKTKLKKLSPDGFHQLLTMIERRLRPVVGKAPGTQPMLYVHQRHYKSRRAEGITDGRIDVDLRTVVEGEHTALKHQPMWLQAIYGILINKRTNIQTGIEVHFPYSCRAMNGPEALDVMADAWLAMKPLLDFVLAKQR